jgi:hypothetical protein
LDENDNEDDEIGLDVVANKGAASLDILAFGSTWMW